MAPRSNNRNKLSIPSPVTTLIKFALVLAINVLAFLPDFYRYRWMIFASEVVFALILRPDPKPFLGFSKFLLVNFIPTFILFYFASNSWQTAVLDFSDYALKILIMFLALFLFYSTTALRDMVTAFGKIGVPKKISFAITIAITFLPILTKEMQKVIAIQEARGYKFRIYRLQPVLIPAILSLLNLSVNLSISLESRGFDI